MDFENLSFLVVGQLKTSRTEALEKYLREKARYLGVIGLMSPFASYNEARCTLYEKGTKSVEFSLPSFSIRKVAWWNRPLMTLSFAIYIVSVFISAMRLKHRFDILISIATFSTALGLILKKMGRVKKVIYYCLDYYPPLDKIDFDSLVNIVYKKIDAWAVKKADIVWEISPRIKEARERYMGVPADSYKKVIVPLGYTAEIRRDCPLDKRERWTLGFVGTLSENQGLQMVIEAMPRLVKKFPDIKVRIIGHGPYTPQLKEAVRRVSAKDQFIFHGFIRDENQVYDILSRCMIGLATWTGDETDNSLYADPGKPKLYALLDLPIIITSAPLISQLIAKTGAGEVINYSVDDFVLAVEKIIGSEERFQVYKGGVKRFKPYCIAENIFDQSFSETAYYLRGRISNE